MEKSTKRAMRRHHRDRLIRNRRKKIGWVHEGTYTGILANTPTPCSCWMCGNPRKFFNMVTDQEVISDLKFIEGAEEAIVYIQKRRNNIKKREY